MYRRLLIVLHTAVSTLTSKLNLNTHIILQTEQNIYANFAPTSQFKTGSSRYTVMQHLSSLVQRRT